MKKQLLILSTLGTCMGAMAQSSVTLFGVVDLTLAHGSGSVSRVTQLAHSGNSSSRIGFRGAEDLGGGMSASFWLEAGVNPDSGVGQNTNTNNKATGPAGGGGLTFNRRSTVSLAGAWGELRLGRDYTPQFATLTLFDPFGNVGVGGNLIFPASNIGLKGPTTVRASNSIGYFLPPTNAGIYGQAMYYLGENPSSAANSKDGTGYGVRAGYAKGPLDAAIAMSRTEYAAGIVKQNNIGIQWKFAVATLMAQASRDNTGAADAKGWLIGASAPVGPGEVRASYARYRVETATQPTSTKLALGYVHHLSKRTALYATVARVRNSGGATFALNGSTTAANMASRGADLGIRHNF